ncbi:MAG TPA: nucleotidyltransferase [Candidatus Magasanikbacteria bacterium]|nr:nucleotidyltransferase [Candidatus Magasanikbacteria bacterium]
MTFHTISSTLIDKLIKGPSPSKGNEIANLQNYIQDILSVGYHTFLQGSYKNDTAISDINDVDIVALRLQTYSGTHSPQPTTQIILWDSIFSEIEAKLKAQTRYNWTVSRGDKCINIRGGFNADVVPAAQIGTDHLVDPIAVYSFRDNVEKINKPRIHYKNGVDKNKLTNNTYKPTVRMFKNWVKNHFGDDKKTISSFKMEALVHSAEHSLFSDDYAVNFPVIANTIINKFRNSYTLPGYISSVCGTENIIANWDPVDRAKFIQKLNESKDNALHAINATSQWHADDYWKRAFNL